VFDRRLQAAVSDRLASMDMRVACWPQLRHGVVVARHEDGGASLCFGYCG